MLRFILTALHLTFAVCMPKVHQTGSRDGLVSLLGLACQEELASDAHQAQADLLFATDGEQTRAEEQWAEGPSDGHASLDVGQLAEALMAGPDQQEEQHFLQLQDVSLLSVCEAVFACLSLCLCMHGHLSGYLCLCVCVCP